MPITTDITLLNYKSNPSPSSAYRPIYLSFPPSIKQTLRHVVVTWQQIVAQLQRPYIITPTRHIFIFE